jgi:hypothetical protein
MTHDHHVLAHVRAAATAAIGAVENRVFEKDAEHFLEILKRVPDHAPTDVSDEDAAGLLRLVDQVVDAIEDRVASGRDSGSAQQRLVQIVYGVRAAMEDIHRWHRHFS